MVDIPWKAAAIALFQVISLLRQRRLILTYPVRSTFWKEGSVIEKQPGNTPGSGFAMIIITFPNSRPTDVRILYEWKC